MPTRNTLLTALRLQSDRLVTLPSLFVVAQENARFVSTSQASTISHSAVSLAGRYGPRCQRPQKRRPGPNHGQLTRPTPGPISGRSIRWRAGYIFALQDRITEPCRVAIASDIELPNREAQRKPPTVRCLHLYTFALLRSTTTRDQGGRTRTRTCSAGGRSFDPDMRCSAL